MITPQSTRLRHVSSDLCRVSVLLLALTAAAAAAPSIARRDDTGAIVGHVRGPSCPPIPCPNPDKADPGCVVPDPDQRAKVGSRCEVHHGQRLRLDIVPIHHGIVSWVPGRNSEDERERFPNAWPWVGGGCVVGPQKFTEVAYCPECRAAYQWDKLRQEVTHRRQGR